jgi:hypothetical protein
VTGLIRWSTAANSTSCAAQPILGTPCLLISVGGCQSELNQHVFDLWNPSLPQLPTTSPLSVNLSPGSLLSLSRCRVRLLSSPIAAIRSLAFHLAFPPCHLQQLASEYAVSKSDVDLYVGARLMQEWRDARLGAERWILRPHRSRDARVCLWYVRCIVRTWLLPILFRFRVCLETHWPVPLIECGWIPIRSLYTTPLHAPCIGRCLR